MITDYDDDPLMAARNKLVAVHLAIHGLAETIAGNEDEILSVECCCTPRCATSTVD